MKIDYIVRIWTAFGYSMIGHSDIVWDDYFEAVEFARGLQARLRRAGAQHWVCVVMFRDPSTGELTETRELGEVKPN